MNSAHRMIFRAATIAAIATIAANGALAQGQIVRGEIDDVRNTVNQFYLKCTNIPCTSVAVNLAAIQDLQGELTVTNIGTATNPAFDVLAFTPTGAEQFEMGNIRLGRSDTWEITGTPGELAVFFYGATGLTGFTPFGAAGSWMLGPDAGTLSVGTINAVGRFQTQIAPPNNPALVGLEVSGQALIGGGAAGWKFTNLDCKTIRAN